MDQPANNVKAIFIGALDHQHGADRAAYLTAACGDNADLRRRVEALLAAHERAAEVLGPAGETSSPESSSWKASVTADYDELTRADVLIAGRYALQQKIGEGGMGEVWVAKQTEPVKRKVALKLIKTGMDSRAVLARFEQERQALAMMDHPNIARVLDGGMTPSGQPFFVMELVNGLPLTRFCDELMLTPRERLELFIPICQAVQHAHQKGIVHRDLKPANILVTLIDGKPIPKVIDFGVAKATGGKLTDASLSTQFGAVVGTLEYMSPEQAGFSGVDVDTRADIYSLGVILYELLTGLRPMDAKRLRQVALAEMIRIIQEEQPSKPSTRLSTDESLPSLAALRHMEPKRLIALLRGELDWVVMKCLEKSRERRYESVSGLARDIERYLADQPVEARPPSAGYRLSKFLRRNRGPVLAASLVLLALVAGLALASYGLVHARHERDLAEKARIEAQAQRAIADKASIEALAQKKVADSQKQQAVVNASKADESARSAELRLAEGLISQGDALSLAGRFLEAHSLYTDAYDKHVALKAPMIAAEVGLWSSYQQTAFPLLSFTGHSGLVISAAIAPDGRTALSGGKDKTLRLWDLATGKELRIFTGHGDGVTSVVFAPDGRTAISASSSLKLWDLATGKELRTFTGHHCYAVNGVAISPDGQTVLSAIGTGSLTLWDIGTGKELRSFGGHSGAVISVAIAPDGRTALSGSSDNTLKHWDLATGAELRTLNGQSDCVNCVAFAPDGRTALSGGDDNMLRLWDLASGKNLHTFIGHSDRVTSIAISPDGRTILSGSLDRTVKLWDLTSGKELRAFVGHSGWVSSVAITPDGRTVLSGSSDETLKLWDFTRGVTHRVLERRVATAQTKLRQAAGDSVALATLGEWYAFRGINHWAVELLGRARERGAAVAPLTLARCYWNLNRNDEARREFQIALEQSKDPGEQTYLRWCIQAIDTEPERNRQQEAVAAVVELERLSARAVEEGKFAEAVAEVADLTKQPNWSADQWYNFACVYSLASAKITDKQKEYAERAMELLQKAVNAGWHDAKHTANDTDLDPLRDREDFKKLLEELEKKPAAQPDRKR